MTKRDKLQEAFGLLFDDFTADEFLRMVGNNVDSFCYRCRYSDECDRAFYELDEDGNYIEDEAGDRVVRRDPASCEDILASHLDEEVKGA